MKLRVVQISESAFSVKGHGVHTAYLETVNALRKQSDIIVATNSLRPADIRHIHTVGLYSLIQLLLPGKKVISAHVVPESFVGSLVGTRYWLGLARWYLRWLYNRADAVIAVSDATRQALIALGVKSRIEVLYNMIDTSRYHLADGEREAVRRELGIAADTTVVIGNGQVQPRKRVDSFIKMAQALPDMECIWVGGMPFGAVAAEHHEMQRLIDTAPPNVRFTGVVSLDDVRRYLAAGDIFVMTSEQETFGLAIVEAAAAGLPIVLRDIPDYDATFRPDAVMVANDDFAAAVKQLTADRTRYRVMQQSAAALAARYDSATISRQLVAIYTALVRPE